MDYGQKDLIGVLLRRLQEQGLIAEESLQEALGRLQAADALPELLRYPSDWVEEASVDEYFTDSQPTAPREDHL